jgi:hypothetical protein
VGEPSRKLVAELGAGREPGWSVENLVEKLLFDRLATLVIIRLIRTDALSEEQFVVQLAAFAELDELDYVGWHRAGPIPPAQDDRQEYRLAVTDIDLHQVTPGHHEAIS